MAEQRYRAVLEGGAGIPVTKVAERYGVSRQTVHTWLLHYRQEGITGLEDRSYQVHNHPWRVLYVVRPRAARCGRSTLTSVAARR